MLIMTAGPALARTRADKLIAELPSAPIDRKIDIAQDLGRSRDPKAVPALLAILDVRNGDPKLSLAVVKSLGQLADPAAEPALTGAWDYLNGVRLQLGDDLPPNLAVLRESVAESLGEVGGDRAREILLEALSDGDSGLIEKAVRALGRLREKRAVEPLQELLSRRGPIGQAAYEALADIGDSRAVPRLEAALRSGDALLGAQAAYALSRCRSDSSDKLALSALMLNENNDGAARVLAAYYLVKLGRDNGLEFLAKTLRSGSSADQALAAQALGKSASPRAALALIDGLKGADEQRKLSIIPNLEMLGGSKAAWALKKLEEDKLMSVRQAALMASARMRQEP